MIDIAAHPDLSSLLAACSKALPVAVLVSSPNLDTIGIVIRQYRSSAGQDGANVYAPFRKVCAASEDAIGFRAVALRQAFRSAQHYQRMITAAGFVAYTQYIGCLALAAVSRELVAMVDDTATLLGQATALAVAVVDDGASSLLDPPDGGHPDAIISGKMALDISIAAMVISAQIRYSSQASQDGDDRIS
jgi:hypothetical protein